MFLFFPRLYIPPSPLLLFFFFFFLSTLTLDLLGPIDSTGIVIYFPCFLLLFLLPSCLGLPCCILLMHSCSCSLVTRHYYSTGLPIPPPPSIDRFNWYSHLPSLPSSSSIMPWSSSCVVLTHGSHFTHFSDSPLPDYRFHHPPRPAPANQGGRLVGFPRDTPVSNKHD